MNQEQITVTVANGQAAVTDNNGNSLPWVNLIYVALDPGTTPIVYFGCTNFNLVVNTPAPTTITPTPTPSPSPTPTPTPAPTPTPTGT